MKRKKILYLSLTGMTEALGRSQVLEYLIELNKINNISLISFEREEDLENIEDIKKLTKENNIQWNYFIYSNKYGIFSTIMQLLKAVLLGKKIIKEKNINIIHARSMIPATMGYILKKLTGAKLLFDIRGFAVDEKVDSKRLNKSSIKFKALKKLDNYLYKTSDHIVTLTQSAKDTLIYNLNIQEYLITVIPTCANKEIFRLLGKESKISFKKSLGFNNEDKIIIHTGTVLNRYDFEKEVLMFKKLNQINSDYKFLIVNKGEHNFIKSFFEKYNIEPSEYVIMSSKFEDVYKYLSISTYSIFFIPPTFAKKAMAPTKFAENVACRLPSITNKGVGDMELYMTKYNVGQIIDFSNFDEDSENLIENILNQKIVKNLDDYSTLFRNHFDKEIAIKKYQNIYDRLN